MALCLLLSCRLSIAIDAANPSGPANPASVGPASTLPSPPSTYLFSPTNPASSMQTGVSTPAPMALPANVNVPADASTTPKFYTLTAELREIYDDNVNTTSINPQTSFETEITPSVLVDFPTPEGDFSARNTFGLTCYSVGPDVGGTGSGGNGTSKNSPAIQYSDQLIAQYSHAFSDRFSLNVAEQFQYDTQPRLLQSTGTNYENGPYVTNILNGTFNAQLTPLIGTVTTFSNTVVQYQDTSVGNDQNSIENTGSESVSYALLPKILVSVGGIVDDLSYDVADRGYITYTAFGGGSWQILPSISVTARGGATLVVPVLGTDSIAPYGALTLNWNLGARSALAFDYAHEITPSDQIGANGQTSDRFNATFTYAITPRLSAHLTGVYTSATTSGGLAISGQLSSYSEQDYEVDTGLTYQSDKYVSFDTGITLSGVDSDLSNNSYTRDEAYVGVRGTY
jgi:hypothetical protein